jgi:hypothetical protein
MDKANIYSIHEMLKSAKYSINSSKIGKHKSANLDIKIF